MKLSGATIVDEKLPEAWRLAYRHDREHPADYADPAPERRAAKALAAFILAGLAFLALPGTFPGVWNLIVISEHRAATAASAAWIQAHGHAQLFGWVGSFIFGISLYVVPKFRGRPLKSFGLVWTIWALWTVGVAWRWWTGIGAPCHWARRGFTPCDYGGVYCHAHLCPGASNPAFFFERPRAL